MRYLCLFKKLPELLVVVAIALVAAGGGCAGQSTSPAGVPAQPGGVMDAETSPADPAVAGTGDPASVPAQPAGGASEATAAVTVEVPADLDTARATDFVRAFGGHYPADAADPVQVAFARFSVSESRFDPQNLEGGTATVEIELASLKTDRDKRDNHLRSDSYFDVSKFPAAVIKIGNVQKAGADVYRAQAEVTCHGITVRWPVAFAVVAQQGTSIRIYARHAFSRLDFGIGGTPDGQRERVGTGVTLEMLLTLTAR